MTKHHAVRTKGLDLEDAIAPVEMAPPGAQTSAAPPFGAPAATLVSAGDLTVAEGATVREALWVTGCLVVGAQALVEGAVTARGGAEVGEGARVLGSLAVTGALRWGRGAVAESATVEGPLVTGAGHVRAASLVAPGGIHAGSTTTPAVSP